MFIICPKCSAKYQIPDDVTLNPEQKFKCSACQNVFILSREEETTSPMPIPTIPENPLLTDEVENDLPEEFHPLKPIASEKSYSVYLWILMIILAIILGGMFVFDFPHSMYQRTQDSVVPLTQLPRTEVVSPVVEAQQADAPIQDETIPFFQVDEDNNFTFTPVKFNTVVQDRVKTVMIEGKIRNDSELPQMLPEMIYAKAYDSQGNLLFIKDIHLAREMLDPNTEKDFFGSFAPITKEIQWIDISCTK